MSTSAALDDRPAPPTKKLPRRIWFPIVWPLVLGAICFWAWHFFDDRGVPNTMINAAVILTVVGWAMWVVRRSGWERAKRWTVAAVLILLLASHYLQFSPWEVVNNGDVGIVDIRWRWAEPDRELQATATAPATALDWQTTPRDYPRFLGNGYWAEVTDVALDPDWETRPPQEKWKQRIGAGWSAFAVVGNYGVTQEQQGEQELVTCYDIRTGELQWAHADPVRFDPRGGGSFGGVGPRATPTIFEGRVYTHGATGILNCLDAATGKLLWSHDTCAEFDVPNLMWGKAASPTIVHDLVVVSVGDASANVDPNTTGKGNSLVAYDRLSGETVWAAGDRCSAYATPVLTTLTGVEQIVVVNQDYITSHNAADGKVLWEHPWPGKSDGDASSSQPVPVGDDRMFFSKGYGLGSELVQVSRDGDKWSVEPIWKRPLMKTKMCNIVLRDGYVYSLDEVNLECIELATGKPQWKKRRSPSFGHGQVLLVGDHLIVTTEEGGVVLVAVDPEEYRELGSFSAVEGVTWNNPTLVGPLLLVRNAEWAACFELPLQSRDPKPAGL